MSSEVQDSAQWGDSEAPAAPAGTEVHEYDGIIEHDNQLPNWWLAILYGTVVFALGYWFYYQVLKVGDSIEKNYQTEMAADYAAAAERARRAGTVTAESLNALARDRATVSEGRQVFSQNCASCHLPTGGGIIGPNLTDEYWLNGGGPTQIFRTVNDGVVAKGMPAWGAQLGAQRTRSVVAFLLTLRNTNVSGGKPPQGEREAP